MLFSLFKKATPTMSQSPKWIYKIFPHSSVDPR